MAGVLAIDPGVTGALLCGAQWWPMPVVHLRKRGRTALDLPGTVALLRAVQPSHALLERQIVISKQGLVSSGTTMRHFGYLEGALCALEIPYTLVEAKDWRKHAHLGKDKVESWLALQRASPGIARTLDGRAASLRIAVADCWCMLQWHGARSPDLYWIC